MNPATRALLLATTAAVAAASAMRNEPCGDPAPPRDERPRECVPGEQAACACRDGRDGVQNCDGDGRRYGVCVCSSPRSWVSLESVGASVAGGVGTVLGTIAAVLPLACRLRLLSDSRGRGPWLRH